MADKRKMKESGSGLNQKLTNYKKLYPIWDLTPGTRMTEDELKEMAQNIMEWLQASDTNIYLGDYIYSTHFCQWKNYKITYEIFSVLGEKYPWFAEFIKEFKEIEKRKLINKTSDGSIYFGMGKFLLSAEYGMSETTKQTVEVKQQQILSIDPLEFIKK